jgi:hypothetical protein
MQRASMPETAIDEHGYTRVREDEVGRPAMIANGTGRDPVA